MRTVESTGNCVLGIVNVARGCASAGIEIRTKSVASRPIANDKLRDVGDERERAMDESQVVMRVTWSSPRSVGNVRLDGSKTTRQQFLVKVHNLRRRTN